MSEHYCEVSDIHNNGSYCLHCSTCHQCLNENIDEKDARIKELEEKLAEVTTWTDANLLTYKDDTTYLVQVYWIDSSSVTVEEMYFCTVAQGWKYSRDSSSPDEPCMITHWLPIPASNEVKSFNIMDAIKNTKCQMRFWCCPDCVGSSVEWVDDVATCKTCGTASDEVKE